MTAARPSPLKEITGRLRDVLFRGEDVLLKELLPKTQDEVIVHAVDSASPADKLRLFRALPLERRTVILFELSDYSLDTVLGALTLHELLEMITVAESDDAVDIIQWLEEGKRNRIIAELRKNDPRGLLPLLVFEEHTAGGRMKTEVLRYRVGQTVEEVRRDLAKEPSGRFKTHFIYVIDPGDVLVGRITPLRLLQVPADAKLGEVMETGVDAVPAYLDQEEVAFLFDEKSAIELPVISTKGRLLGCITADDIFGVMEEEYSEDVSRMAGVHTEAHISDPIWLSARRRMPWLAVNLVTAMVAATVVGMFQDTISRIVILAAFMPIIAGMGGNAAQQALAVTVRAIALGELRHLNTIRVVVKEIFVGVLNGFLAGVVVGLLALLWTGNSALGTVIVLAMTLNLFVAGLVGVAVPVTLKAFRADPALASTVFVTATTDIFGFFAFLSLATLLL